jgi:Na+-transporting NADH:ubiquinone oxidoreductase subunit NqrD
MQMSLTVFYLSQLGLELALIWRAVRCRLFKRFPFFYSYLVYDACCSSLVFALYWIRPSAYPTAYWLDFVLSSVVEFAVLLEISDQVFQHFPAIRHLGRALTILISFAFGAVYILPAMVESHKPSPALLDFALRGSVTKAVILAVLVVTAHHFGLRLGKNVAGLMLGFSIYLGVNVANTAAAESFGRALSATVLWIVPPSAFVLCLLVWTISLWEPALMPSTDSVRPAARGDSQALTLELARFNSALSRLLHR